MLKKDQLVSVVKTLRYYFKPYFGKEYKIEIVTEIREKVRSSILLKNKQIFIQFFNEYTDIEIFDAFKKSFNSSRFYTYEIVSNFLEMKKK